MHVKDFDNKAPAEIIPLTFDFKNITADISSAVVSVAVKRGTDAAPGAMIVAPHQVVGVEVRQLVKDGLDGVTYLYRCDAVNAAGDKYALGGYLSVNEIN
mgnify:CR=1 FL=1